MVAAKNLFFCVGAEVGTGVSTRGISAKKVKAGKGR